MSDHILPAGRYYIGDPCYVTEEHPKPLVFLMNGKARRFFIHSTAYGDGRFALEGTGVYKELRVDSGTIAVLPEDMVDEDEVKKANSKIWGEDGDGLFCFHDFDNDFDVSYRAGSFHFGELVIAPMTTLSNFCRAANFHVNPRDRPPPTLGFLPAGGVIPMKRISTKGAKGL